MSELVRLTSVVKAYSQHSRIAIEQLSFSAGQRVLVSGGNGSGKSTLLRLVAGISIPTTGFIWRADEWRRLRIGYVPQTGGLYDDLSVEANFDVRRILYGSTNDADAIIERLQLGPWVSKRTGDLSGGYRRFVATAMALAVVPDVLILDEPFDGLDDDRRQALTAILSERAPQLRLMIVAAPTDEYPIPSLDEVVSLGRGR